MSGLGMPAALEISTTPSRPRPAEQSGARRSRRPRSRLRRGRAFGGAAPIGRAGGCPRRRGCASPRRWAPPGRRSGTDQPAQAAMKQSPSRPPAPGYASCATGDSAGLRRWLSRSSTMTIRSHPASRSRLVQQLRRGNYLGLVDGGPPQCRRASYQVATCLVTCERPMYRPPDPPACRGTRGSRGRSPASTRGHFIGLSMYMVCIDGASKPVSHISRTITSLSDHLGFSRRFARRSRRALVPICGCQACGIGGRASHHHLDRALPHRRRCANRGAARRSDL